MKKPVSFKFEEQSVERLKRLSKSENTSQANLIEKALLNYEQSKNDDKKLFMEAYHLIYKNIQMLEMTRDHERELTKEENEIHEFYYETWEKMRTMPFFEE